MADKARRRIVAVIEDIMPENVNSPWVIRIAREDAPSLAVLRLVSDVEVGETDDEVWLRGKGADELLTVTLSKLPARERYEWLAPDQLRQIDRRIPSARLPDLRWHPSITWLQVALPVAALPAIEPRAIPLHLVRSTAECEPELLMTGLEEFKRFVSQAALVRLNPLDFAVNSGREVLVRGTPLPPLPGRRFVLHGGVAVPAGFSWQPAVSAEVLARCFSASSGALVLWNEDGAITRMHREQFVSATRSAVRATEQALAEPG